MKKINGFEDVKASGDNIQLPAGGYIAMVTAVEDVPDKEYLKISFDIAIGEYAHYFGDMEERLGWNNGVFYRSYKENALGMFKQFTNVIEESNDGYKWNFEEKTLRAKVFGVILGEEEYIKNDGSVGTRLRVASVKNVKAIEEGKFKVPEKKLVEKPEAAPADLIPTDLPF